jgi:protein kinase-like protein
MKVDWKEYEGQVVREKFLLHQLLGSTEHSAVFLTQSGPQSKNGAIKFLSAGTGADSQSALWRRASQLSHPHLLRLLGGGRCLLGEMDLLYLTMEYAEEDLGQILPHRPLTTQETHDLLVPLLGALAYLHSKGFAHGHLKPSNILAIGDRLKLASDTVIPLGESCTPHRPADAYDSPEAATALPATSADVWSLGMTLVETLTQHVPVLPADGQADPVIPPDLPEPFLEIARQSLRRDPRLRWTVAQIANCLSPASVLVAVPEAAADAAKSVPALVATPEATGDSGKTALAPVATSGVGADAGKAPAASIVTAATAATSGKPAEPQKDLWVDSNYCWVVVCKNHWFHKRPNIFNVHRIPLGETDAVLPRPEIGGLITVRCDECGRQYVYKPSDVLRYEMEAPPSFVPHPLFH